jgi:hypothetical protein
VDLTQQFKGDHLAYGVRLTIYVTETDWIGKAFGFVVMKQKSQQAQISCLRPNSYSIGSCTPSSA